ncbi:hypothetical protein F971_01957 [Acinetobacter vivianii]|uniref:Uncharacterized protein n=1 Tax=Acinetobacter vivianii TaxID=1776742 RepID=N8UXG6_9GAMM|nr:hypothetical protein F971_01957 [Acinetobacter vivianii]
MITTEATFEGNYIKIGKYMLTYHVADSGEVFWKIFKSGILVESTFRLDTAIQYCVEKRG